MDSIEPTADDDARDGVGTGAVTPPSGPVPSATVAGSTNGSRPSAAPADEVVIDLRDHRPAPSAPQLPPPGPIPVAPTAAPSVPPSITPLPGAPLRVPSPVGSADAGPTTAPSAGSAPARPVSADVVARCGLGTLLLAVAAVVALLLLRSVDGGVGPAAALGLFAAGVLGGAALWWWGVLTARRRIDEPVERLRRTVAAARRGELEARSELPGDTEVAALGRDLDDLLTVAQGRVAWLNQQAEWGVQVRMIFEALDLANDEAAAHQVVREALGMLDPARPMELLLAPPDSTELLPVAVNPGTAAPACPVTDLDGCVAVRRSRTVVFDSSESINSCPRLKDRPSGPCSAVCVPVSVAGRAVGALHATGPDRRPPDQVTVDKLATLATQLGNRLGAVRALETSRAEAATDPLTGLPNRRTLEHRLEQLLERHVPFVLVVADLDNFKAINSGHGLETGDRALVTFANVLRDKVRGNDLVARYGGEEFVLVYPEMSVDISVEAIERIRDGLEDAIALSGIPWFTCSFGITHSGVGLTPEAVIRVANAGLERAKALGRDQAVYADAALADRVFGPEH